MKTGDGSENLMQRRGFYPGRQQVAEIECSGGQFRNRGNTSNTRAQNFRNVALFGRNRNEVEPFLASKVAKEEYRAASRNGNDFGEEDRRVRFIAVEESLQQNAEGTGQIQLLRHSVLE